MQATPHKRGIRNGPKALKPAPVLSIRCKSCGQAKLPHFCCCSGDRGRMVSEIIEQSGQVNYLRSGFR
ncbi:ribosomal protein [Salix suchowensis]|nr:ribosomal protein [Salix suchowensis]